MAKPKKNAKSTMADRADKFKLYEKSVQTPGHEVDFFIQAYQDFQASTPITLREDFCGTFAICCEWVKSDKRRKAIGVDLCGETLQWGLDNNLSKLNPEQKRRIRLIEQDVRKRNKPTVDVLAAQNFSFWIFKTRAEVVDYFKIARSNLNDGGILVMDMMGGGDCFTEDFVDKRTIKKGKKGFRYHWSQIAFNPITADASFSISFKFPDGSKLKHAFEYHWRFWTLPEVREMLVEAGFSENHVYWEIDEEEDPQREGQWERREVAPSDPSWICYVVASK